eukprot:Em0003g1569a
MPEISAKDYCGLTCQSPTTRRIPEQYRSEIEEQIKSMDGSCGHLQAKLAELQDFVEANTVQAGAAQKTNFDSHAKLRLFKEGDTVWLSVPKYSKLGSKWEGKWIIKSVKNAINMEITDGTRKRIFHINRLQHRNQRQCDEVPPKDHPTIDVWNAPQMNHIITSPDPAKRRPAR